MSPTKSSDGKTTAGAVEILGLDHVVLRVRDVNRAMRFYGDVLGCLEERRQDELGLIQLRAGRTLIDLIDANGKLGREGGAPPGTEGYNMDHFCLQIATFNPAALRAHLARHGIDMGEVKQRYGAEGEGPSVYIKDPDGNIVELKGPPTGERFPG